MDISDYIAAYREPYEKALTELASLTERLEQIDIERDEIFTRMAEVREGIAALAALVKEKPAETHPELFPDESEIGADLGLTDAIRKVLANANPKKLTPVGVRTGLAAIGFKTESKNLLSSIHSVLKRLKKSNEVMSEAGEDGRTWYKWNAPVYKPDPPVHRRSGPGFFQSALESTIAKAMDDAIKGPSTSAAKRALEKAIEEGQKFDKRR